MNNDPHLVFFFFFCFCFCLPLASEASVFTGVCRGGEQKGVPWPGYLTPYPCPHHYPQPAIGQGTPTPPLPQSGPGTPLPPTTWVGHATDRIRHGGNPRLFTQDDFFVLFFCFVFVVLLQLYKALTNYESFSYTPI